MKPRIAIIGVGRWGKNLLREFNTVSDIAYCVHRGSKETQEWLTANYPDITSTSYDHVLADVTVQAVVVATPINTHFELARRALEAGKHVFLEKPGCESREELSTLIQLAQEKKRGLQIGYIFLHHPAFTYLKKHIADPITSITCSWEKFGSFEEGIIQNLACHEFSLLYGLKNIAPSHNTLLYMTPGISSGDSVGIRAEYSDGSSATLSINRMSATKRKNLTIVTRDTLWFWEGTRVLTSTHQKPYELVFEDSSSPLSCECLEFVTLITTEPCILYGDVALAVHDSLASLR